MSRDGSRLYSYAQYRADAQARVYVFDTSQAVSGTTDLPILGFIPLADMPSCHYNPSTYAKCDPWIGMAISDDGQTLFLAGDRKFIVLPVPSALASAAADKRTVLRALPR